MRRLVQRFVLALPRARAQRSGARARNRRLHYTRFASLRFRDTIEFHRQTVNIKSIVVKDGLGHRNCSSIMSKSTVSLSTSTISLTNV